MRTLILGVFLFLAFAPPKGAVNFLSHFYELLFRIYHYDIEQLAENKQELGWSEKILCVNEYYSDEMKRFLKDETRAKNILSHHTGKWTEKVTVGGEAFVVKTHKYEGFWQNLFVLGRGVEIWNHALRAKKEGLPVLKPVALVEKRGWNSTTSSIVYLMEGEHSDSIAQVEKLVEKMNQLRYLMRDFTLENIVFLEQNPQLIDIGRLFLYPKYSIIYPRVFAKQIERFNQEEPRIYERKLFLWDYVMREVAHLYQRCWPIFHYDYAALDNPDYVKKITYKEKFLCKREYDTPAMQRFLAGEDKQPRGLMSVHDGYVTERIELDGRGFIVKTTEERGFFKNLLEMNIGVKIWNNGHLAKDLGLPALEPVALLERRTLGHSESLVIYPMEGKILKDAMETRSDLTPAIEDIVHKMADLHVIHAEFRPLNAILLDDGHVRLVDIDGLHTYPKYSYLYKKRLDIEIDRFNKKARLSGLLDYVIIVGNAS